MSENNFEMDGSCLCGKIRYHAVLENGSDAYYCHCRMCQKAFGNIFATFANTKKSDVQWITQEPDYYQSSAIAKRGYCNSCGTPLTFEFLDSENLDLSVGSMDRPEDMRPTSHTGIESRIPSFHLVEDGLIEERVVDNKKVMERWEKAYGKNHAGLKSLENNSN
jgi:hypothetical protein